MTDLNLNFKKLTSNKTIYSANNHGVKGVTVESLFGSNNNSTKASGEENLFSSSTAETTGQNSKAQGDAAWEKLQSGQYNVADAMKVIISNDKTLSEEEKQQKIAQAEERQKVSDECKSATSEGMTYDQADAIYQKYMKQYGEYGSSMRKINQEDGIVDDDCIENTIAREGTPEELAEFKRAKAARRALAENQKSKTGAAPWTYQQTELGKKLGQKKV